MRTEVFVHDLNHHAQPAFVPSGFGAGQTPFLYGRGTHRAISLTFAPGKESTSGSPSVTSTVCS